MNKLQVKAKVQVTLEISVGSNWGTDCDFEQVHKQASEEALNALDKKLADAQKTTGCGFCIVGKPKVIATTFERA